MGFFFIYCFFCNIACDNSHVTNLLTSNNAVKNVPGWTINARMRPWNNEECSKDGIWSSHLRGDNKIGFARTTLKGPGHAKMGIGNCYPSGSVEVYLDKKKIYSTPSNTIFHNSNLEFEFPDGAELEIRDGGYDSVIRFESFEVTNCTGNCLIGVSFFANTIIHRYFTLKEVLLYAD